MTSSLSQLTQAVHEAIRRAAIYSAEYIRGKVMPAKRGRIFSPVPQRIHHRQIRVHDGRGPVVVGLEQGSQRPIAARVQIEGLLGGIVIGFEDLVLRDDV